MASTTTACGICGRSHRSFYDRKVRRVRDLSSGDARVFLEIEVRRVLCKTRGKVKTEELAGLTNSPFLTKRFAYYVGHRCRLSAIRDVAKELKLSWRTVKVLEMQ